MLNGVHMWHGGQYYMLCCRSYHCVALTGAFKDDLHLRECSYARSARVNS